MELQAYKEKVMEVLVNAGYSSQTARVHNDMTLNEAYQVAGFRAAGYDLEGAFDKVFGEANAMAS